MAGRVPLQIRKLADKTAGDRIPRFDPETGEKLLVDPSDPVDGEGAYKHTPWPLAGVVFEGDPPREARIPTSSVATWASEGWLEVVDPDVKVVPSGPADDPWKPGSAPHVFMQARELVFKTVDGDVRYRVTHQPGKYGADGKPTEQAGDPDATVDWFYDVKLMAGV